MAWITHGLIIAVRASGIARLRSSTDKRQLVTCRVRASPDTVDYLPNHRRAELMFHLEQATEAVLQDRFAVNFVEIMEL